MLKMLFASDADRLQDLLANDVLWLAYLLKNRAYRYEEEVRFVFGTNPASVYEDTTLAKSTERGL